MADQLAQHLGSVAIFAYLSPNELQIIEKYMFFNTINPGEFVFKEGEKGDYVCFVIHGMLEVIKINQNDQPVVLAQLTKGASIGEMALIDRLTRSASVRASGPTGLVVLTRKGFEMILRLHPEIGINILKGIASLLSLNLRKTSERLAEFMPTLG
jgi:CRP/FNR family transcriptional regulator, cyclic AMP receptor protein